MKYPIGAVLIRIENNSDWDIQAGYKGAIITITRHDTKDTCMQNKSYKNKAYSFMYKNIEYWSHNYKKLEKQFIPASRLARILYL